MDTRPYLLLLDWNGTPVSPYDTAGRIVRTPGFGDSRGDSTADAAGLLPVGLKQRHMTPPSNFVLRIIVEEDARLVRTLNANYADAAADGGLEAGEKELLFDILARHFTGRPWPRSGGMDATRHFMAELQSAMIATRWSADLLVVA